MSLTSANGSNSISMSVEMNGIVYTGKAQGSLPPLPTWPGPPRGEGVALSFISYLGEGAVQRSEDRLWESIFFFYPGFW